MLSHNLVQHGSVHLWVLSTKSTARKFPSNNAIELLIPFLLCAFILFILDELPAPPRSLQSIGPNFVCLAWRSCKSHGIWRIGYSISSSIAWMTARLKISDWSTMDCPNLRFPPSWQREHICPTPRPYIHHAVLQAGPFLQRPPTAFYPLCKTRAHWTNLKMHQSIWIGMNCLILKVMIFLGWPARWRTLTTWIRKIWNSCIDFYSFIYSLINDHTEWNLNSSGHLYHS